MSELEKWSDAMNERLSLDAFLEWLQEQNIVLAVWTEGARWPVPTPEGRNELLNRYFHIDAKRLDEERRRLLSSVRK